MKNKIKKELLTIMAVIMFAIDANMIASTFVNWNLDSVDKTIVLVMGTFMAIAALIGSVCHIYGRAEDLTEDLRLLIWIIIRIRSGMLLMALMCLGRLVHFLTASFFATMAVAVICLLTGICLLFIKEGR
jgi:hypothetical protein